MSGAQKIIERLSRLLHDEISAIGAGQLETVRDLYPQKVALLAELEQASGGLEKQLRAGGPDAAELAQALQGLHRLIRKDHELLERMTAATGRAAKELARIRDRHGLGGIYGASGTLRDGDVAIVQRVDQSI